jgi:hypothetical protein
VVPASSFPAPAHPAAGALLPAGLGSCTGLYVAVRRIRGAEGLARVQIADRVPGGADGAQNRLLSRTVTIA